MGVLITSIPSEANISLKLAVNFAFAVSAEVPERPTVLCDIPLPGRGTLT